MRRAARADRAMSLGEHLTELRKRASRAALAVAGGTALGWFLADLLWAALRHPIEAFSRAHGQEASINYGNISGAFDLHVQIALTVGIVVASPVWLYQVFAFLVPGLTRNETRYVLGFLGAAVPLFLGGCLAGWFVLPHIVQLLTGFAAPGTTSFLDARAYYDFALKLVVATGVAFVLPVFIVLLNFIGVLEGRTVLRSWRYAILAIVLFTAVATPAADVLAMFLLAIPMVLLYLAACAVSIGHDRLALRRAAALHLPAPRA